MKIPDDLLGRLERRAAHEGKSKGAVVRETLEKNLEGESDPLDEVRKITAAMFKGKKIRMKRKVDWENLRRKASLNPSSLTPEEEVLEFRRRRL